MVCREAEAAECMQLVQEHYAKILVSKILSLMKTNLRRAELGGTSVTFELSADYIERNLKQDIFGEELALQAQMSLRSLRLFERNAKITLNTKSVRKRPSR